MEEVASSVNWNEIAAQTTVLGLMGGAILKLVWSKLEGIMDKKIDAFDKQVQAEFDKRDNKRHEDKTQTFNTINGIGARVQSLETEIALQKQTDTRHDKELDELSENHKTLHKEFNQLAEKIWQELKDIREFFSSIVRN